MNHMNHVLNLVTKDPPYIIGIIVMIIIMIYMSIHIFKKVKSADIGSGQVSMTTVMMLYMFEFIISLVLGVIISFGVLCILFYCGY